MGRASTTSPLDPEQMVPDQPSGLFDGPHVWLARASFLSYSSYLNRRMISLIETLLVIIEGERVN